MHGGDQRLTGQRAVPKRVNPEKAEEHLAFERLAQLVADHKAIAVAVVRNTDLRTTLAHLCAELLGVLAADLIVDVEPVGMVADEQEFGAPATKRDRACFTSGTVG